jgi:hypothetical protein
MPNQKSCRLISAISSILSESCSWFNSHMTIGRRFNLIQFQIEFVNLEVMRGFRFCAEPVVIHKCGYDHSGREHRNFYDIRAGKKCVNRRFQFRILCGTSYKRLGESFRTILQHTIRKRRSDPDREEHFQHLLRNLTGYLFLFRSVGSVLTSRWPSAPRSILLDNGILYQFDSG